MVVITEEYKKWREVIFNVKPEQVGVSSQEVDRVYGVLMDIGQADTGGRGNFALSLTALASGEASFRPTPGGGAIGLGGDAKVAEVAKSLVQIGQATISATKATTDFASLPKPGWVRFTYLTTSGVRSVEGQLNVMLSPHNPFSKLMNGFGFIRNFAEKLGTRR